MVASPPPSRTSPTDLTLITSLYQAKAHLPAYRAHAAAVIADVRRAGLTAELVLVANGPSADERRAVEQLAAEARQAGATVIIQYVARETVYASWNRGVRASTGACIGVWNVDDVRYAAALVEGARLIADGCEVVDFPFVQLVRRNWFGAFTTFRRTVYPAPFDPARITPRAGFGPFFLFARALYERAGGFDERFRITGDFEWSARETVRAARACHGKALGGEFVLHGANLSGARSPLEWVEHNTVLLRHGQWDALRPVDPSLMRTTWEAWGSQGQDVPPEVAARLWGADAEAFRQHWERARLAAKVRRIPRNVLDRTGLRPVLAELGLVQPPDASEE